MLERKVARNSEEIQIVLLLVDDLNRVAIFMSRKRLRNRYPTHRSRRLISSLLSVDDSACRTLDVETLKIIVSITIKRKISRLALRLPFEDHFSD